MKFLYGLALALIFFEGFISQCEGAGGSEEASTSINLKNLPNNVYEEILFRTGFSATEKAAKDRQRSLGAVKNILEDRIIQIIPMNWDDEEIREVDQRHRGDNIYLNIYGGKRILSLFKNFGDLIKKIKIDKYKRHQINENIVKNFKKLETLNVIASNIEKLIEINAFITYFPFIMNLKETLESFGRKKHLNIISQELKQSHKPTWKVNYVNPKASYGYILMQRSK
ncbi:uncharacterized protein LOC116337587 [Contarinia nasturtii]|uniref:uncharacterized protein LOC116337587 n=1 Tax=Contarinia nasturtii TaxID=265458 RepID=UPI0012D497C3|nr:uncharacterized protein LOC116337587 [Contarinia nasturtii]